MDSSIAPEEWYATAVKYFNAAISLIEICSKDTKDDDAGNGMGKYGILIQPIYFLTVHGVELTLKAGLLDAGLSLDDVKGIRHDIVKLWKNKNNDPLRELVAAQANGIDNMMHTSIVHMQPCPNVKTIDIVNTAIVDIGKLHKMNGSRFKYPSTRDEPCIIPHVLIDVFYPIAHAEMKRIVEARDQDASPVTPPESPGWR